MAERCLERPQNLKKTKKAIALFLRKGHKSDIFGKNYGNLLYFHLNRRFIGSFYSKFSLEIKRLG